MWGGVSVGLDDQPGASVFLDVVAEDLVLAFVCIEVARAAGVGDLSCAIASTGRAEQIDRALPLAWGLPVVRTGGQASAHSPQHLGRVPRSASNR